MHTIVSLKKMKINLGYANRIANKNQAFPLLASILLYTENNSLKIRSTNLSLGIQLSMSADIKIEGTVLVSGSLFYQFIASLPDTNDSIELKKEKDTLLVISNTQKTIFKTIENDDFPTLPEKTGETFDFPKESFIHGIESVYYSTAKTDIKPELASVFIYSSNDTIVFVATDSFRLAEKKIKTDTIYNFPPVLIPYKNVVEIVKILEIVDSAIEITISKNQIYFSSTNLFLTSQLLDGVFPDYTQIIPKQSTTTVKLLKEDVISVLKTAVIFSDALNHTTFEVNPSNKNIVITSHNQTAGEHEAFLNGVIEGEAVTVSLNHSYISECLQNIKSEKIELSFSGEKKPVTIKSANDPSFLYLIMPVNR